MSSNSSADSNSTSFNNGQGQANASTTLQTANQGIEPGYWHQDIELFFICFCCFFIIFFILVRTWVRRKNNKRFRADDYWILFAAFLTIPYWLCQVATNRFGSGIHIEVVPDSWGKDYLGFERGWAAYYFITSMIKVSELILILDLLPERFRKLRMGIYFLCCCIMSLGLALSLAWFFQCKPVASNFDWTVTADTCINFGPPRYAWIGIGTVFDIFIAGIPIALLRKMMFKSFERSLLICLFSANILGTVLLLTGIYGVFLTGDPTRFPDYTWDETVYIILQNLETLAYTLGAFAPVLSRFIVRKHGSRSATYEQYKLRQNKSSEKYKHSGHSKQSYETGPPSYHSRGEGSISKPPHSYPSTAQLARHDVTTNPAAAYPDTRQCAQDGTFHLPTPTLPGHSEGELISSAWHPLPGEP